MKNRWFAPVAFVAAVSLLIGCVALIYSVKSSAPTNIIEGTVSNFEDSVINSPTPVYIEFYVGKGCKPCDDEKPIVEKLAIEYQGKVRFIRVDVSKYPEIAAAVGVTKVPTHLFINPAEGVGGGAEGFLDEATMRQFIEAGLKLKRPAPANPADPAKPDADPAKQDPAKQEPDKSGEPVKKDSDKPAATPAGGAKK